MEEKEEEEKEEEEKDAIWELAEAEDEVKEGSSDGV